MKAMQKSFICVIEVATICSLVFVSPISGYDFNIDLNNIQQSLQDDTVFGNYTSDGTFTYYKSCRPSVFIGVYDPDGVDSVWLTYRRANETSVLNQSMDIYPLGYSNRYVGSFEVSVSLSETEFIVLFHANDSLGYQTSSNEFSLFILYNPPDPPANGSFDPNLIIGLSIAIVVSVGLFYLWRKGLIGINE